MNDVDGDGIIGVIVAVGAVYYVASKTYTIVTGRDLSRDLHKRAVRAYNRFRNRNYRPDHSWWANA